MLKRICDRCNKEIKGTYWIISIYEREDNTMRSTIEGAANNIQQNIRRMFNNEKEYCEECIEKVEKVILNKGEEGGEGDDSKRIEKIFRK